MSRIARAIHRPLRAVGLGEEPRLEQSPARQLVLRAVQELSGFVRGVIYDLPTTAAPRRFSVGSVFVRGSPAWQRYLTARRGVDDGELKALLALRQLPEAERLLAIDWGTRYANTFLYIEPRRPDCDLTDPANPVCCDLEQTATTLLGRARPTLDPATPWTRDSALGDRLRDVFGAWVYWSLGTWPSLVSHSVLLRPSHPSETLASLLVPQLPRYFPQGTFDLALANLYRFDAELFRGPVTRARVPFRTRLGLPILPDPHCVDRALRRRVNEGGASVTGCEDGLRVHYGRDRPLPDSMSEEEFERLMF